MTAGLLRIGDFAERCGVPVSTLRFYDRIGVLRPGAVDPVTGYRWYGVDQVPAGRLAARLRAIGLPPSAIAVVLAGGPDAAAVLSTQRDRLHAELALRSAALAELERLLAVAPYRIRVVDLPTEEVVALPVAAPADELPAAVLRGVARLCTNLRRNGTAWTGPWGGAFPADPRGSTVHGFVFVRPVTSTCPTLDSAWLPGGPAAEVVHRGAVADLPRAYAAAHRWITAAGRRVAGPVVEEYLPGPQVRVLLPLSG